MIRDALDADAAPAAPRLDLDLFSLLALLRREQRKALLIVAATLALGCAYVALAPRSYSSTADILVSTRQKDLVAARPQPETLTGLVDPGVIESQVEILKSSSVLLNVVRKLDLLHDDAFLGRSRWNPLARLRETIAGWLRPSAEGDGTLIAEQWAVKTIADRLKVKRVGMTYVVNLQYSGLSPDLAYKITKGIAEEYIEGELRAKYDNSRRATEWFRQRLLDLDRDVAQADHEVQRYRAANNLVDTIHGRLDEEELSNINAQLAAAQSDSAQAKAKYERAQAVMGADLADATLSDSLRSELIGKLREQYLRLAAKRSELTARYGADHRLVGDLARDMDEVSHAARAEVERIAQAAKSDLEIALSRESQLRAAVVKLVAKFAERNESQVALSNLESNLKVTRNVYDASLEKFQLNAQEQAAPMEIARVITPANYPDRASWPHASIVLAASLALGMVAAVSSVLAGEALCDVFRSADDVRAFAGLPCLGVLPRLTGADLPPPHAAQDGLLGAATPLMRVAVDDPLSGFARTVRDIKVSIDLAKRPGEPITVAILSTRAGEGKTTLAANLALQSARMGRRTLLIDGDLHSFRLTSALMPAARAGLLQALASTRASSEFCALDATTGLRFLPAVASGRIYNAAEILRSGPMERALAAARTEFEYIFVDLPAVQSDIDARAAAALFDAFVYVIESRATGRREVRVALAELAPARERILGAVLTKGRA